MQFLLLKGNLYRTYNGNLLFHGCVPLNEDGTFKEVTVYGKTYAGKALYDILENDVRKAYYMKPEQDKEHSLDIFWLIWSNRNSPVDGTEKMETFERYVIKDQQLKIEKKGCNYE